MTWYDPPTQKVTAISLGQSDANGTVKRFDFASARAEPSLRRSGDFPRVPSVRLAGDATLADPLEAAREEGYEAGLRDGLAQQEADHTQQHAEAVRQGADIVRQLTELQTRLEHDLWDTSVALARAYVKHFLPNYVATDPAAALHFATQAVARAVGLGNTILAVHPSLLPHLEPHVASLRNHHPEGAAVELLGDALLQPGDFRLISPAGRVESDLSDRLARLDKAIALALSTPVADATEHGEP